VHFSPRSLCIDGQLQIHRKNFRNVSERTTDLDATKIDNAPALCKYMAQQKADYYPAARESFAQTAAIPMCTR
jgi:hypothetical protein